MTITLNEEKNGIEVKFGDKPEQSVLDGLKAHGFRWSKPQKMWYARQSDERLEFVRSLDGGGISVPVNETPENRPVFDLWTLTRTDDIPDFYATEHLHDNKEIAKRVREHIKDRFPMVKFSVTKDDFSGGGSIDGRIKAAPWAKDSDEMKAVLDYCDKYLNAYNYDNSDSYSDYWDVNFYDTFQFSYDYEQTAYTDADKISELFRQKKEVAEEQERLEEERRFEEYEKQRKIDEENAKIAEKKLSEAIALVEERARVKKIDYWMLNALDCNLKCCNIDEVVSEVKNNGNGCRRTVHVRTAVYLNEEDYKTVSNNLMADYSFCSGHGRTATDDLRIHSIDDYSKMTQDERDSVEWYVDDAIAIYCEGILKFIANPEGYNYIRYAIIFDDKYEMRPAYRGATGITEDEADEYARKADALIGAYNKIGDDCNADALRKWCHENNFKLSKEIIRALPCGEVKSCAYSALLTVPAVQEQFDAADLKQGQKITIVRDGAFVMPSVTLATVESVTHEQYAQYTDSVKVNVKIKGKRGLYSVRFYRQDSAVYDGWLEDLPRSLFFEEVREGTNGLRCEMSRFTSCDMRIMETALDYYGEQGHEPIINTFNNRF